MEKMQTGSEFPATLHLALVHIHSDYLVHPLQYEKYLSLIEFALSVE